MRLTRRLQEAETPARTGWASGWRSVTDEEAHQENARFARDTLPICSPPMSLRFEVEHRAGYSVIRVAGEPSLGQFLSFLHLMGVETSAWPTRRVLFDLRGVQTLTTFTEHYAVGEEASRQLSHLHRLASLVAPDRITRASEKTARRSGLNLTVFTDEAEAIAWLLE